MRLKLETKVASPPEKVWAGFNEELFVKLAPPLPKFKLLRFDGCHSGGRVEVQLNFVFFTQLWHSVIVDQGATDQEFWFVDEGEKLPFFLKTWRHTHRIVGSGEGSTIVDDIEFRSPFFLLDWILWPSLWLQFAYRKPIYRRVFG